MSGARRIFYRVVTVPDVRGFVHAQAVAQEGTNGVICLDPHGPTFSLHVSKLRPAHVRAG